MTEIASNNKLGKCVYERNDNHGPVTVFEKHNKRYLTFGNAVEQSCLNLDKPYQLDHSYTQAMMLALLLKKDIRRALLLGLGGGSLVRALRHVRTNLEIHAVEYRSIVIDVAQEWFLLPDDKNIHLHCDDAVDFITQPEPEYDLMFTDLYLAAGVHDAQNDGGFLSNCQKHLSDSGILMANQWSDSYSDAQLAREALKAAFGNKLLSLHVEGGSIVTFAFNGPLPKLNPKQFYADAQALGVLLDIPLQQLARNFWRQNAQALKLGRYLG